MPTFSTAKLALGLAGTAIIAALLLTLVTSWMSRGQEIARLKEWQGQVVLATTDAYAFADEPGKVRKSFAPEDVPHAIDMLGHNVKTLLTAQAALTHDTEQAKLRADNADRALANATVLFEQRYQSAEKRIAALDNRPPAATPELQCQAIGIDSKAPWEAWR
jgi:hypothetical protein